MDPKSAAELYRRASVESAPPLRIVCLLYRGALRFLQQAQSLDPVRDSVGFNALLNRAEAVVEELRCSLRHDVSPALSEQLDALYLFVQRQIAEASIQRDGAPLEGARRVLERLLEGWSSIELEAESA